ncbi:hypothetical protein [Luteimonas panaciterrae]|uniref:hypothetical protein n=1 Tax=Luteimonas panaciterrae TaxID=363885 RepID=UPI001CFA20B9|nr:hypothetical protein [Luteimonas panaciterrae]
MSMYIYGSAVAFLSLFSSQVAAECIDSNLGATKAIAMHKTIPVGSSPGITLKSSGISPIVIDGLEVEVFTNNDTLYYPRLYNCTYNPIKVSLATLASFSAGVAAANKTIQPGEFLNTDPDGIVYASSTISEMQLVDLAVNNKWYRLTWFVTLDDQGKKNRVVRIFVHRYY